jgi:hypothetical protein
MKSYSFFTPTSEELLELKIEQHELKNFFANLYTNPQEDNLLQSDSKPIFVVADGVTLDFKKLLLTGRPYPDPSPAGEISKIFCEGVISKANKLYDSFEEKHIAETFLSASQKVKVRNDEAGEVIVSGNPTGKFAATGSFIVLKGNKVYWMSICDSYFAHFNKDMDLKYMTSGNCDPYAVINGDPGMVEHIESGAFDVEPGDKLFIFTDGFYHYIKNKDFLNLFHNFDDSLKQRVQTFSKTMINVDPEKYGHERSLIAVTL